MEFSVNFLRRIRFFSSNILNIDSPDTVFQYFLYGVSSLNKVKQLHSYDIFLQLELPKCTYNELVGMKEYIITGDRDWFDS